MSKVDLQVLGRSSQDEPEHTIPTAMQEVDLALKECGFGRFHIKLLLSAYVGCTCGLIVSITTPYILPIAECDLNMSLLQKGVLNAIPYVGTIVSSSLAGFLTDSFGRKRFIVCGFLGIFFFTVISGLSQKYSILVTSKFFEGLLFAISFSPFLALTSELCHSGIRDQVMLVQMSFLVIGQISVALISWAILRCDWRDVLFNGYIVLNTWNYYLLIMSVWSLCASILYMFLPESPKFYVTQRKYNEARDVLIRVYKENTGKPAETFKYVNLWKDEMKQAMVETPEGEHKSQLSAGFENIKPLFRRPLLLYLLLFCFINYFTMMQYNVLQLWFPQLSTIVENYSQNGTDDFCVILDAYTHGLRIKVNMTSVDDVCVPVRSGDETYLNTVILGCICLVPCIITSILVNKVGKKNLFLVCGLLSVGCTIALRWTVSKILLVSLFSTDVSTARAMLSLTQAMVLELFPTSYRSLAMGLVMMAGRMGTLVGNVTFPILLDLGCVIPFFTLSALMLGTCIMALFLPTKMT